MNARKTQIQKDDSTPTYIFTLVGITRQHIQAVSMGAVVAGALADSSVYLPLSLPRAARRPLALRSTIFLRSLSIFSLTITT